MGTERRKLGPAHSVRPTVRRALGKTVRKTVRPLLSALGSAHSVRTAGGGVRKYTPARLRVFITVRCAPKVEQLRVRHASELARAGR